MIIAAATSRSTSTVHMTAGLPSSAQEPVVGGVDDGNRRSASRADVRDAVLKERQQAAPARRCARRRPRATPMIETIPREDQGDAGPLLGGERSMFRERGNQTHRPDVWVLLQRVVESAQVAALALQEPVDPGEFIEPRLKRPRDLDSPPLERRTRSCTRQAVS